MTAPYRQIDVDLELLRTNGQGIGQDTDVTLAPGITDAHRRIFRGLHIGSRTQSGEVDAARRALAYAMDRFWHNGVAHVERAKRVVALLDWMLTQYRTADDFAKLDLDRALASLEQAATASPSRPPRTPGDVP